VIDKQIWDVWGGSSAWGLGKELTTPHLIKQACYKMLHRAVELDVIIGMTVATKWI
jgi:hypothetical protein